jgi:hypothetical protein
LIRFNLVAALIANLAPTAHQANGTHAIAKSGTNEPIISAVLSDIQSSQIIFAYIDIYLSFFQSLVLYISFTFASTQYVDITSIKYLTFNHSNIISYNFCFSSSDNSGLLASICFLNLL